MKRACALLCVLLAAGCADSGGAEPLTSDGASNSCKPWPTAHIDESGWRGLWEREGIDDACAWLRETGFKVLMEQRAKLTEHPALLAGCRRRWIVVSRYAGMEVSEATDLWNKSDK